MNYEYYSQTVRNTSDTMLQTVQNAIDDYIKIHTCLPSMVIINAIERLELPYTCWNTYSYNSVYNWPGYPYIPLHSMQDEEVLQFTSQKDIPLTLHQGQIICLGEEPNFLNIPTEKRSSLHWSELDTVEVPSIAA